MPTSDCQFASFTVRERRKGDSHRQAQFLSARQLFCRHERDLSPGVGTQYPIFSFGDFCTAGVVFRDFLILSHSGTARQRGKLRLARPLRPTIDASLHRPWNRVAIPMDAISNSFFGLPRGFVAPAILTSASAVMALSTSNRFGLAIDRFTAIRSFSMPVDSESR